MRSERVQSSAPDPRGLFGRPRNPDGAPGRHAPHCRREGTVLAREGLGPGSGPSRPGRFRSSSPGRVARPRATPHPSVCSIGPPEAAAMLLFVHCGEPLSGPGSSAKPAALPRFVAGPVFGAKTA
jgi:hypothetical protein